MPDELTMRRRGDRARPSGTRRRSAVGRRLRPEREILEDRLAPAVAGWTGVGAVASVPALVSGTSNSTTTAGSGSASVPTAAQYAVSESLGKNDPAYAVTAWGDGYVASNTANQYTAAVDAGGLRVSTGSDAWSLTVQGVGYGDSLQALGAGAATASANRVEYDYGAVSQWFVNGPLGLQQGFTLDQRPAGGVAGAPLTVDLTLGGDLTATADAGGTSVTLARADGGSALSYGGLIAYDAAGKAIPAQLSVSTTAAGQSLSIQVDDAGAQYPLTIDPFVQQTRLSGAAVDLSYFGYSAGMNGAGTELIVGAKGQNFGPNNGRGVAYIFTRNGSTWTQKATLTASDAANGDELGTSVSLSLDGLTAIVGAPNATVDGHALQGAAYVFSSAGGSWVQTKKVTASDGAAGDHFGASASIDADGGVFVVGAPDAKVGANAGQGASYVFSKSAGVWTQKAKLVASAGAAGDGLGTSASISGDGGTIALGAPDAVGQKGAVYVFTGAAASWAQAPRLVASDAVAGDQFGLAVSTSYDGGVVLTGAPGVSTGPGAAYIYTKSGASWAQAAKLVAGDGTANDQFGSSVAISANGLVAVVGSPLTTVGSNANQGATYVFMKTGASWPQREKVLAGDGLAYDLFGSSVALSTDGGVLLSGAPRAGVGVHLIQGVAYVYNYTAPVAVTLNPVNQTTTVGSTATFTAAATGAPSPIVQWQVSTDGGATYTNIPGASQNWLTVTPSLADSNNLYRAYFLNTANSAAPSTPAKLTVVRQNTVLTITSSSNPRPIGGALSFTVTAASANGVGTPTGGQVDLYFGTVHYSGTLVNGKAVFQSIPVQALGTYTAAATYGGDAAFGFTSATMTQVVVKGTSYLTGTVPTQATAGQPVTIKGVMTYTGTTQPPYGGVMIMDNGQPINYVQVATAGGVTSASYTTSALSVGTHYIRLIYFGNPETLASASDIYTLVINPAGGGASTANSAPVTAGAGSSTAPAPVAGGAAASSVGGSSTSPISNAVTTQAASSPVTVTTNPISQTTVLGTTATFTASAVGSAQLGVQWQVSADGATFTNIAGANQTSLVLTPGLADSTKQYRAVFTDYLGTYTPTTAATLTVVRRSTVLTITSSSNPRPIGGALSFTVTAASANGVGTPTGGQVDLYFGTVHYSGTLVNGKAVFQSIPVQALGTYTAAATYGGDANFDWTSATMTEVVVKGTSYLTGYVPTQATAGQPVAMTGVMTYTGTTQPPYGGVVIMDNGQPINYVQMTTSGGVTAAQYSTSTLSVGTHYIRLIYFGNPETLASASDIYTLVINPAASQTTAVATTSGANAGGPTPASFAALGALPTSKSTTAAIVTAPAPKAAAVQPRIAVVAPRASAARVLQQRFTVAFKAR